MLGAPGLCGRAARTPLPMLLADDLHALRLAHETPENMVITAEMKLKASLMRKESRCATPPRCPGYRLRELAGLDQHLAGRKGQMQLEKQPFDMWRNYNCLAIRRQTFGTASMG